MARFSKQTHGNVNPILHQEEIGLLAALEKAQQSTSNSQILGRNGEKGITDFLNRHLPSSFRTMSGHFVTPGGTLSPETDVLVLDARYPLLAKNEDGSVVAMLHSVLATIEVKLSLTKSEIQKIRTNSRTVSVLNDEVFTNSRKWGRLSQTAFAYSTRIKLDTLSKHFFSEFSEGDPATDLSLLRVHDSDHVDGEGSLGAYLWLEDGNLPYVQTSLAPLSDLYYRLVQDAYYALSGRDFDFGEIGQHMNEYMSWGTYSCLSRGAG